MILSNVRLIDGTGRVTEKADIRIEGEHITEISEVRIPGSNEEILNLDGKTVMPGLINCHTCTGNRRNQECHPGRNRFH